MRVDKVDKKGRGALFNSAILDNFERIPSLLSTFINLINL